jgi:hypothetical protein
VNLLPITRGKRVTITIGFAAAGAVGGYLLTMQGHSRRERVLTVMFSATAAMGGAHTILSLVTTEAEDASRSAIR